MRVLSYDECADRACITRRTFERHLADGVGPAIVFLSARRRGVIESDFNEWLLSRRQAVAAPVEPRRPRGRPRKHPVDVNGEAA